MKQLILLFLCLTLFSCGKETTKKSSSAYQSVSGIYGSTALNINIFYEPGAEPYDGKLLSPWTNIMRPNLEALFQNRSPKPAVSVPATIDQMSKIAANNKATWSIDDVLALAKTVATTEASGTSTFKIFFVKGYAEESSGIIGFHISGTKVMVIFKDVINSMSTSDPLVSIYVEQAVIIHEMGHALGLVNNGVKMIAKHQDTTHGAHCSNPDCVMYWSNEGKSDMQKFIQKMIQSQNTIMFDTDCLTDSRNF